jgi:hypothetical protein
MWAKTASRRATIDPHPDDVRAQMLRIVESRIFAGVEQLCVLFEFIVDETLAGRQNRLHLTFAEPRNKHDLQRVREALQQFYRQNPAEPVLITIPRGAHGARFDLKLFDAGLEKSHGTRRVHLRGHCDR